MTMMIEEKSPVKSRLEQVRRMGNDNGGKARRGGGGGKALLSRGGVQLAKTTSSMFPVPTNLHL